MITQFNIKTIKWEIIICQRKPFPRKQILNIIIYHWYKDVDIISKKFYINFLSLGIL